MKILKNFCKYTILTGLFAIPFIPFIVPDSMFFPFISGKGFTFRIIVEIIFGLFVLLAFADKEYRPKMSWVTKSVLFFSLAILVADLFSMNSYKSFWSNYERMEGFVLIAHLVLFYFVSSSMFKGTKHWLQYFNVSIVASVLMSIYGVFQLLGFAQINQGGVRVDATFGNAAYLAVYLLIHIFLCLYLLFGHSKALWQKWTYGLMALLQVIILYFTATRGAILGLIGGLLLAGLLMIIKERENKTLRKFSIILISSIIIIIVGFIALKNTSFIKNSPVLSRFSTLSFSELQTQGRYYVWPMAVKGFVESPKTVLVGWGQESFNYVFNKYYDPRMYAQEQWFDRTHDVFLDWLIAGGLLGFLGYFSMYFVLLYYVWRRKSHFSNLEKSLITGMLAGYIFHNIFVFDNLISYVLFFSLLGYVHSSVTEKTEAKGRFYTANYSQDVLNFMVAPLVLILVISGIYFINVPAIKANYALIKAMTPQKDGGAEKNLELFKKVFAYNSFGSTEALEQLVQLTAQMNTSQISATIQQEFYNLSKEKVESKLKETPHDARYLVFAGSFYNRFAQYDLAIPVLERAIAESPKKQPIYFELGTSYLGKRDYTKAFELFTRAYNLEPDSMESKIIYTVGAIYTKNQAVLNQMSSRLDNSVIVSDGRFLRAYSDIGDYNKVISILNTRLQKDPTNLQDKFTLASTYATIGNNQKAISLIREMIAQDPSLKEQGEQYIKQLGG